MNDRNGRSNFNVFLIIAALIVIIFVVYYFYYQPTPEVGTTVMPADQTTPATPGPGPNGPTPRPTDTNQPTP